MMKNIIRVSVVTVGILLTIVRGLSAEPVVSIVRSDDAGLARPADPKADLSRGQIEELVRKAVALIGGIGTVVKPEHKWIVIKPNIVEATQRGTGDITDSYVVWALVKMVHEAAPTARITIAEGAGSWMSPGHPEIEKMFQGWAQVVDGFAIAGYRDILRDPALAGTKVDIVDLNFDESVERQVPGGGNAREKYFIPKTVLNCDVFIDVPVLKVTNVIGFTNAMKNMVGICP